MDYRSNLENNSESSARFIQTQKNDQHVSLENKFNLHLSFTSYTTLIRGGEYMKRNSLKKWSFIGLISIAIGLAVMLLFQKSLLVFADKTVTTDEPIAIATPTIFVPGTNGTVDRFDGLIKTIGATDVLKVTVQTDGTVTSTGNLTADTSQPIIVIGFEDSSDDTLSSQGEWYQLALAYIQQYYSFDTYNYLGHSNGGLVITSYLENNQKSSDPTLAKLITLGTPYNDTSDAYNDAVTSFTQIKDTSALLTTYLKNTENISSTLQVLNIAGEVDDTASDGTVPVQSVFSGRLIYQEQVASYQEILIEGSDTSHSELVENATVIQYLKNFFWSAA